MTGDLKIGNLVAGLTLDTSGFAKGVSNMAGALDGFKKTIAAVKSALTAMLSNPVVLAAAAVAALISVGKAAHEAYVEMDKAYDALAVGTGAVGDSLDSLKKSFDSVYKNATYVSSTEDLANVLADLNTYLGVTGTELEGLATQISDLQGMNMDVSVAELSKAFNRWGIETSKASGYLDYFVTVSQNTGITIDELSKALQTSQTYLNLFGFNMQESAKLIGNMSKAGYTATTIAEAFKSLTTHGITTKDQFAALNTAIQGAASQTDALQIATQYYGEKAAVVVDLIRSGAFANLSEDIDTAAGATARLAESTASASDKWDKLNRKLEASGAGIGQFIDDQLFAFLTGVSDIMEAVERIGDAITKAFHLDKLNPFNEGLKTTKTVLITLADIVDWIVDKIEWAGLAMDFLSGGLTDILNGKQLGTTARESGTLDALLAKHEGDATGRKLDDIEDTSVDNTDRICDSVEGLGEEFTGIPTALSTSLTGMSQTIADGNAKLISALNPSVTTTVTTNSSNAALKTITVSTNSTATNTSNASTHGKIVNYEKQFEGGGNYGQTQWKVTYEDGTVGYISTASQGSNLADYLSSDGYLKTTTYNKQQYASESKALASQGIGGYDSSGRYWSQASLDNLKAAGVDISKGINGTTWDTYTGGGSSSSSSSSSGKVTGWKNGQAVYESTTPVTHTVSEYGNSGTTVNITVNGNVSSSSTVEKAASSAARALSSGTSG